MSLLSDLQTLSHGEFTRAYGAPLGYDKFLEYQILAATRAAMDPMSLADLTVTDTLNIGSSDIAETAPNALRVNADVNLDLLTAAGITCSDSILRMRNGSSVIRYGTGDPNGSVSGSPGDLYLNLSGGASTTLYVKESGAATTTGWVGK